MNKLRDLKADLELCNNATPGPWYREKTGANFKGFSSEVIIADTSRYTTGNKVYAEPEGGQFPSSDADFIAQAREGWPHAIERAIKAEALICELVEVLRDSNGYIQHHIEYGHIPSPKGDNPLLLHTPGNIRSALTKVKEVLGE